MNSSALASTEHNFNGKRSAYDRHYVQALFDAIAYRYDFLNRLLSSGIDVYWRRKAIQLLQPYRPKHILDVATGTADLAIEAAKLNPKHIIGVDLSPNMLAIGKRKIAQRGLDATISLEEGIAEWLEFPDDTFDAVSVAFGVRNFENLEIGLAEMLRVLRPGGVAVVLEFSTPRTFPVAQAYRWYSKTLLPVIGGWISRNRSAYEYLPTTAAAFPDNQKFLDILTKVGYTHCSQHRMTFGIATAYVAEKAQHD
ncbi:MAG: bifunctional demethylmenaquinone methyltransferase/2-methoxy-6-polyprenyl-1,4-benzoquinol methylase UbiE [Ignavibacteriales bacterium]|nr:bifunctional demethylmenaquinone methyltransferase/2-methoxy-6-polyprenyl-1,4-benzoquinol methylase UbiE [Ignavibacteriales bacterium]